MREVTELHGAQCRRTLLEVSLVAMVKGTRHTWCYYTGGHGKGVWVKFVLSYGLGKALRVSRDEGDTDFMYSKGKVIPSL